MDTPGLDVESVTGMVGGGAQVVLFTTGLGHADRQPDRAGDQDHRQRAHGADDGRQHRRRRQRRADRRRIVRGRRRAPVRRSARGGVGPADRRRAPRPSRVRDSSPQPDDSETSGTQEQRGHAPHGASHMVDVPRVRPRHARSRLGARRPFRWTICGLLFLAATINYVDRQVIGILKPTLQAEFGWTRDRLRRHRLRVPARLRDRVPVRRPDHRSPRHQARVRARADRSGRWPRWRRRRSTRFGPAAAVLLGAFGLAYSASVAGFIVVALPARPRRVGQLSRRRSRRSRNGFPQRERAFATGLFNAGTNIGAVDHADDRAVHHRARSAGTGRSSSPACSGSPGWSRGW